MKIHIWETTYVNTTKTAGSTGAERNLLNRNLQEGIKKQKKKSKIREIRAT